MYWVSGSLTIGESRICPAVHGVRRHACGLSSPFTEGLLGDLGERQRLDAMVVHVTLDLDPEELRRDHHPGRPVPGRQ